MSSNLNNNSSFQFESILFVNLFWFFIIVFFLSLLLFIITNIFLEDKIKYFSTYSFDYCDLIN